MAKFCSNCGISLNDDEKFCGTCGYKQGKDAPRPDAAKNIRTPKLKVIKTPFLFGGSAASALVLAAVLTFTNVFGSFGNTAGGANSGFIERNNEVIWYPGITIDKNFEIIAERVAQINAGNIAGGNAADMASFSEEQIKEMVEQYMNMDIDATIESMKADYSEKQLKDIRKYYEESKKKAQKGTLADELRKGFVMSAGGNFVQYPLNGLLPSEAMEGYKPKDWEATAEWALSISDELATATTFGTLTPGIVHAAGLAVSVYPHPLLLNNYAGVLRADSPLDALFFYFAALEFEPQNPIILSNIGMTYLDMENYEVAKGYAELALLTNPGCGQAYQILTICHLKDGNAVLAAETLFKSTLDLIDDLTISLFEQYFAGTAALDPSKDKYPINDLVLELLYEMAKKHIDTADVDEVVDKPTGQLNIKPFPSFGGGDDVMNNYAVVSSAINEENTNKYRSLEGKIRDKEKDVLPDYIKSEAGELKTLCNQRQYYAFSVLNDY
jgi:tetratricopeptide (TPR) repeat protein